MSAAVPPVAPSAAAVPPSAARLAVLGLVPFVVGAALVWLVRPDAQDYVVLALSAYAALVVGFLAGIHWGLAMRNPQATTADYALPLALWGGAWVAVVMPPSAGLVVAGVLLAASYLVDRRRYPAEGLAHWLTLRFRLSLGAAFCCFLAAAGL